MRSVVERPGASRRLAVAVVVAVSAAVGLAGCGASGAPDAPTPSGEVQGTTAPEPDPVEPDPEPSAPLETIPPERPAAMDTVDKAGAEAVATYFLNLYPYVYATGDLAVWTELSHPECVFCKSVIDNVTASHAAGHTNEGGLIATGDAFVAEVDPGRWYSVELELDQEPAVEYDRDGVVVEEHPEPQHYRVVFALVFEGSWLVRELDVHELPFGDQ